MSDPTNQLFVQIYSKLAAALSVPGVVGEDSSSIMSLQIPGVYIRPNLKFDDPATQFYVSNALDAVLACSWTASKKAGTVSDIYKSILDGKQMPLSHLTPEECKELDAAFAYLYDPDGDPSEAYCAYQNCQLNYMTALDAYEAAGATQKNGGPPVPQNLSDNLKKAEQAWNERGHKGDVERAIATVNQYEGLEPAVFWKGLADRFAQYTRTINDGSEFQYVTSNPPYEQWFEEFGWSKFDFDMTDFKRQSRAGGVGVTGCCCCCCCCVQNAPDASAHLGPFSLLGNPSACEIPFLMDKEDFKLSCSMRRVEIVRPWMNTNVFYSRAWRWSPFSVSYGVLLSTGGDLAGRVVPSGVMPVLPMTVLLVKDLEVYWKSETGMKALEKHVQQGHECYLGPFRLSRATLQDEHRISMPDPQLIGFISSILPKSPNPDPALNWPHLTKNRSEWP
jgi:hypothetical protein